MKVDLRIFVFLFALSDGIDCANILALFPLPLYSHTNSFMPVFKELADRGHNLTMVSPFPQKKPLANWTDLVTDTTPVHTSFNKAINTFIGLSPYLFFFEFWKFCANTMEAMYEDKTLQWLIKSEDLNFDLIITEPLFAHESLLALGHKLNIPVVGVYPLPITAWSRYILNNELFPAYIPNCRTSYHSKMNFFQRVDNFIINTFELLTGIYYLPLQEKLLEKYWTYPGSENRPRLIDLLRNVSLHLIDSHFSIGYVEPLPPHIIPVGGLSLRTSGHLPDDLQKYIDDSKKGVIYLSFGSNIRVSSLDKEIIDEMLDTFRELDVNVLMKWENETLENKPDNVEIRPWFPQTDILAHPKCLLFITHGGLHGISEAAHYGVPILGIPFFSDQKFNLKFAESEGFGRMLLLQQITAGKFKQVINSILNNKSYKENAERRSMISKDRPESPLNTAVYWIEYVLRHKDVSHLKPASRHLFLFQLYHVDVILALIGAVLTPFILVYFSCKIIFKSKRRSKQKSE